MKQGSITITMFSVQARDILIWLTSGFPVLYISLYLYPTNVLNIFRTFFIFCMLSKYESWQIGRKASLPCLKRSKIEIYFGPGRDISSFSHLSEQMSKNLMTGWKDGIHGIRDFLPPKWDFTARI